MKCTQYLPCDRRYLFLHLCNDSLKTKDFSAPSTGTVTVNSDFRRQIWFILKQHSCILWRDGRNH